MFTSVAEGLSGRLTERGTLALLVPAAIFWAGGVAALFLHGHGGLWGWGLASLATVDVTGLQQTIPKLFSLSAFEQFLLVTGVVVTSALAVDRFVLPVLQLTEGYFPTWLDFVRRPLVERRLHRVERDRRKLARLAKTFDKHS